MAKQSINLADFTEPDLLENIRAKESLLKAIPPKGTAYYTSEAELLFLTETIGGAPQSYNPTDEMDEQADMSRSGKHALLDAFDQLYGLDEEEVEFIGYEDIPLETEMITSLENSQENECSDSNEANGPIIASIITDNLPQLILEEKMDAISIKQKIFSKKEKWGGDGSHAQKHYRTKKGLTFYRGNNISFRTLHL